MVLGVYLSSRYSRDGLVAGLHTCVENVSNGTEKKVVDEKLPDIRKGDTGAFLGMTSEMT